MRITGMAMDDINAIDTMCRAYYGKPELGKELFDLQEMKTATETTFKGVKERANIADGEEWKILKLFGPSSMPELYEEMDDVGVEKVFMDQGEQYFESTDSPKGLIDVEELGQIAADSDGRIVPGVGYNPLQVEESLDRLEHAVESYDFKYVWFHPMTFGLSPSDERCYPLYTKCLDLDIPVCFQTGQSAETLQSDTGHPMKADKVAIDFPSLDLVLTHTGWPWVDEWCSMLWRFPNVYGNIGAYYPSFLPDRQVEFINQRISNKVMWATNGLGLERCKQEFRDLDLKPETEQAVLRENAFEVFDI
jgi:predicted TIM-barrel fold metal-dependent hydrolase